MTQESRHGTLAAQQSVMPMLRTGRFFAEARDAWQKSLVQEAGGCLPYSLYAAACCGSGSFRHLPAGRATSGLLTVTQEPSRIMVAQQSGMPMLSASRFFAEAPDAWQKSLVQEAAAACRVVCTLPHAAEASSSHGCRKQSGLPAHGEHGWLAAKHGLYAWLGVTSTTNKWFQPEGAYSRIGTRRLPMLPVEGPIGFRWR